MTITKDLTLQLVNRSSTFIFVPRFDIFLGLLADNPPDHVKLRAVKTQERLDNYLIGQK